MAARDRKVCDQDVRDRVVGDLATTFLLEAGAGTGKTRVLVERYVRCVLDPTLGTGDVRSVAAITFTEKAAGELRQRVREEFEARAVRAHQGSREATVIAEALEALDDAPISTIHGFAARLLREFPVEAGVDPAFEQLDGIGSEIERARLWDEWLSAVAAGAAEARERQGLARLLRAGVGLDAVRELAVGSGGLFGERYDLDPVPARAAEPDLATGLARLIAPLPRLKEFCREACSDISDNGYSVAMELVEAVGKLLEEPADGLDQLAAALFAVPTRTSATAPGGKKDAWSHALGGKDELRARYAALVAEVGELREDYADYLTGLAVAVADGFSRWAGQAQIRLGRLDFTDLLGRLRDLLKSDLGSRGALQRRFRFILVDEFQDTDPLQVEIVFFLCEREPLARDWREVVLAPGKLFLVGDSKQSIYRFRRADISLYDEVRALVAGQPASAGVVAAIRQNFRTTPAVLAWVNDVFAEVFDSDAAEGRQPGYGRVEAFRRAAEAPRVAVLLGREYGARSSGEADAARRDEARALAALLMEMHASESERWLVEDREAPAAERERSGAAGAGQALRPPAWGDIALLFRATTGLETYEQTLREARIPYRVEGGKTYFARREVADALLCLRAADDLSDGPALYGALHSSFFGFSDDELFLFWAAGGRFDLFADGQPSGHEAVVAALGTLRTMHERSTECEPHEMAGELVRLGHAAEFLAATGAGAPQAIANLEKLVERAQAFSGAGGHGLGAFLAWAAQAGDAAGEQESQVDDQGDAVRLLTIHKAKGLEYPIVVLVGGALASGSGGREQVRPIVDRAERRLAVRLKAELPGGAERQVEPRAYGKLKAREDEMAASELRRLLYVASTRARDWLVVTCFGKLATQKAEPVANSMLAPIGTALPTPGLAPAAEERVDRGVLVLPPRDLLESSERDEALDAATMVAARSAWLRERAALLLEAGRPARATSPSGVEHIDEELRRGGPGTPPGRARALALGSDVHRVMELCDLHDESSLARLSAAVTLDLGRPDLAEPAAALAGVCWRSAPVRAAAASAEVYRELPVGALVDGAIVNGAVDLLYRDDGEWVLVDFKTDLDAEASALRERYAPQGAAYALAVEAATAGVVREVIFVAAAADGLAVSVPVDDVLRESARREVAAAVDEWRPISADEFAAPPPAETSSSPPVDQSHVTH